MGQALLELRNPHSILATLQQRPKAVRQVRFSGNHLKGVWAAVAEHAAEHRIAVSRTPPNRSRQSRRGTERHDGAVAMVDAPQPVSLADALGTAANGDVVLALDCIQDPQNTGAIFRSASFFGVQAVITTKNKSAPINATVCDIAAGGTESVPFHVATNLVRALEQARDAGYWILGSSEHAENSVFDVDDRPWVVVIGNEQSGIRRLTRETCDEVCRVTPRGKVTSLNAAAATTSLLTVLTRRR